MWSNSYVFKHVQCVDAEVFMHRNLRNSEWLPTSSHDEANVRNSAWVTYVIGMLKRAHEAHITHHQC